jgi:hypothetical protein
MSKYPMCFFINKWAVYNQGPISTSISNSISSNKHKFVFVYQDHLTKCVYCDSLNLKEGKLHASM